MAALATTRGENRHTFYERILVTKPPVSINRDMYTGFKPGTSEEKMAGHLGGIKSNLKFLLDKENKNDDETKQSDIAWDESFGIIEIDEIQGTSLHNTILLVDEYQLLRTDTLKLVLSRISENSKVVLIGDTAGQTYGMNRANEGFKVLYKHLGTAPEFNYVKLNNIYRSKLAKFVENIFTD
jgi:PhoH-like ATPase